MNLLVTAGAYLGFVAGVALLFARYSAVLPSGIPPSAFFSRPGAKPATLAACAGLGSFLFFPAGVLPPIVSTGVDMGLVCSLYLAALFALRRTGPENAQHAGRVLTGLLPWLCVTAVLFGWMGFTRGLPGEPLSFATLVSLPPWAVMGGAGRAGLVALGLGLATLAGTALPVFSSSESGTHKPSGAFFAWAILRLSIAQFAVILLLPFTISGLLFHDMPSCAPVLDFVGNWVLTFALARWLFPAVARRVRGRLAACVLFFCGAVLCVFGAL